MLLQLIDCLQPSTTTKGDVTSSSLQESQSLPHSGLSPVLRKYKQYLQSCYNAKTLAPADKYLPTLEAPYITLAMIKRERYNSEERDEFTRKTLHGGVDQILQSKVPIKIEDLVVPECREDIIISREDSLTSSIPIQRNLKQNTKPVRFVLVEGPPGIGKSTFAWEVCRRWDEIESLRHYHTAVLLKLREKWVLNATSLSDLFRYPSHPDFSHTIAEEVVESQGESLLLVLDGFDEVSHNFHRNSVIKSILCRQLLPKSTIILTTRPSAKHVLASVCQPQVHRHVEIIGFTEEERVRYITEVFGNDPELQVNFLKYMFLVPHIKSMMYIPLNCAIIAQVYCESQGKCPLAIPRTRTQLYKALTHSLLVRHMKMKESKCDHACLLPEGLNKEDMGMFKILAKFAFNSYHNNQWSRKVTFFKEDIPEGLVHFGFMNESTEMYAGKGVEQTFSFLHLSLQEYLAAWHLADSYSIQCQVAYHFLALNVRLPCVYKGVSKKEEALITSLKTLKPLLVQPALFLAGITGWRCQSEGEINHWEMYIGRNTAEVGLNGVSVLLRSLYEAQNLPVLSHYIDFFFGLKSNIVIGLESKRTLIHTPYDCYALSYCLAKYSDYFNLSFDINNYDDISLVEIFVKGLNDHCKFTALKVSNLKIESKLYPVKLYNKLLLWLSKAKSLAEVEGLKCDSRLLNCDHAHLFLKFLIKLQLLEVSMNSSFVSWEWVAAMKSLSTLKVLHISSKKECNPPPITLNCWPEEHKLKDLVLDVQFPSNASIYDLHTPTDALLNSVLKSILRSKQITKLVLPNISRENMANVRSILLHCPSLATLELKRTRLGYDGILYICSALRKNQSLIYLLIHDDLEPICWPPSEEETENRQFFSHCVTQIWHKSYPVVECFSSRGRVILPCKTTVTDFLLELNDILKDNSSLKEMNIQSGLFLPLFTNECKDYCKWTGLGPLQQFNVGAVGSGVSPNLRRSFSSSDLTQPQTLFFRRCLFEYKPRKVGKGLPKLPKQKGLSSLFKYTKPKTSDIDMMKVSKQEEDELDRASPFLEMIDIEGLFSKTEDDFIPSVLVDKGLSSKPKEGERDKVSLVFGFEPKYSPLSFTTPDAAVLQSFSCLDYRLKECLEISHLYQYVESVKQIKMKIRTNILKDLTPQHPTDDKWPDPLFV